MSHMWIFQGYVVSQVDNEVQYEKLIVTKTKVSWKVHQNKYNGKVHSNFQVKR